MLHFPSPDIGMFGRRQRHARGHRIPVTIVRGDAPRTPDAAIVVDEFEADEAPLGGGCPCCTVRVELQAALRRLFAEREKSKHFSRVVIETVSELGPILRTFATERGLETKYYVEAAPPLAGNRFELTEDAPFSWNAFSRFISTLTELRGADVLHAQGLLNVEGCRGPVVVRFLGHLAHVPVELQAWPDEDRSSRIEFTTRNIEAKTVRALFDSVRTLA